jgi:Uma2 family endonuclease
MVFSIPENLWLFNKIRNIRDKRYRNKRREIKEYWWFKPNNILHLENAKMPTSNKYPFKSFILYRRLQYEKWINRISWIQLLIIDKLW